MSRLREDVIVDTGTDKLHGELFVGADGLPEVRILGGREQNRIYLPATFPAEWRVMSPTCGTLYGSWDLIRSLVEEIALAQREADDEDRDCA